MRTSAAGSRSPASAGFTLLELLVVMAIVAIGSAGIGLALRDNTQVQLEREGQRLAALLDAARARSRASGVAVRWRVQPEGFRFDGLATGELIERWLDADTRVATEAGDSSAPVLLLGPEPVLTPQSVLLISKSQTHQRVRVASDGVRPFAVQAVTP